jgi:hypothetical protein
MNNFESNRAETEESVLKRAEKFALDQVGELTEGVDPKKYWDDFYASYYDYLDSEKLLNRFDEEKKTKEWEFFTWENARDEVFMFSKSIAEYLKECEIKDLVIVDRSSRPLYIGVREYWKDVYQNTPMPNIYFLNPKGFKNVDEMTYFELNAVNDHAAWKGDRDESYLEARTKDEIIDEFESIYPKLVADKDKPILVFDTCIHSGDTLSPLVKTLENMGFTDVRIGSVNPAEEGSSVQTDFYITHRRPEKGCYPFDRDRMIEKTFEHVYSQRTQDIQKRRAGNQLREEIKRIMLEHLGKKED